MGSQHGLHQCKGAGCKFMGVPQKYLRVLFRGPHDGNAISSWGSTVRSVISITTCTAPLDAAIVINLLVPYSWSSVRLWVHFGF